MRLSGPRWKAPQIYHDPRASWDRLGAVITGMTAKGFDVELKQFPAAWRATFYPTGIAQRNTATATARSATARSRRTYGPTWPCSRNRASGKPGAVHVGLLQTKYGAPVGRLRTPAPVKGVALPRGPRTGATASPRLGVA